MGTLGDKICILENSLIPYLFIYLFIIRKGRKVGQALD